MDGGGGRGDSGAGGTGCEGGAGTTSAGPGDDAGTTSAGHEDDAGTTSAGHEEEGSSAHEDIAKYFVPLSGRIARSVRWISFCSSTHCR